MEGNKDRKSTQEMSDNKLNSHLADPSSDVWKLRANDSTSADGSDTKVVIGKEQLNVSVNMDGLNIPIINMDEVMDDIDTTVPLLPNGQNKSKMQFNMNDQVLPNPESVIAPLQNGKNNLANVANSNEKTDTLNILDSNDTGKGRNSPTMRRAPKLKRQFSQPVRKKEFLTVYTKLPAVEPTDVLLDNPDVLDNPDLDDPESLDVEGEDSPVTESTDLSLTSPTDSFKNNPYLNIAMDYLKVHHVSY